MAVQFLDPCSLKSLHVHLRFLRWSVCALQNKNSDFCAPLTSFDWNDTDPKRLGTSSIDTTCTIWDIEVGLPANLDGLTATLPCDIKCCLQTRILLGKSPHDHVGISVNAPVDTSPIHATPTV